MCKIQRVSEYFKVRHESSAQPCAPFRFLTLRERQILQRLASGLTQRQAGDDIGLSVKTVERHVAQMGNLGVNTRLTGYMEVFTPAQSRATILALIQDGITHGYLKHAPVSEPAQALTPNQYEIVHLTMQGFSNKEIAEKLHIGLSTVEKQLETTFKKLRVTDRYMLSARITYLQLSGEWEYPVSKRVKVRKKIDQ